MPPGAGTILVQTHGGESRLRKGMTQVALGFQMTNVSTHRGDNFKKKPQTVPFTNRFPKCIDIKGGMIWPSFVCDSHFLFKF